MLVTEFQEILKKVNSKFIKRIDILNNYVDLYNEDTKKAVQVRICNSADIFREAIFEAIRQINDKISICGDTRDFLELFSEYWNDERTSFIIKRLGLDWFIEIRDFAKGQVMGSYILSETEATKIINHFEGIKKPTLKQLLESIN